MKNRPPVSFLRHNARPLGFGLLHAFCSSPGQTIVIGLFIPGFATAFQLSASEIGALYLAANLASATTLLSIGHLIDSTSLRRFSTATIAALAAACFLAALTQNALMLGVAFFALRITGQSLMVHIEATATARAFTADRGRALAITGLGLPLADALMPSIVLAGIAALGWRGTYTAIGLVLIALVLPLARFLASRTAPPATAPVWFGRRLLSAFRLLASNRLFWAALPAVAIMPFILTGILFNATSIAAARGWSRELMAASFPAMAIPHIAALFLSGRLVDRFSGLAVFRLHAIPVFSGLLVLAWVGPGWALPAGLLLIGLSGGIAKTSGTAIWAELFGTANLGAIRSFIAVYTALSTALAPFAFGLLTDAGWSWPGILTLCAGGAICAAAPLILVRT